MSLITFKNRPIWSHCSCTVARIGNFYCKNWLQKFYWSKGSHNYAGFVCVYYTAPPGWIPSTIFFQTITILTEESVQKLAYLKMGRNKFRAIFCFWLEKLSVSFLSVHWLIKQPDSLTYLACFSWLYFT